MEDRVVPAVVFSDTYVWNDVTVTVTVDDNAPSYPGLYHWDYHVTNDSFAGGVVAFAVPVELPGMASNFGSSAGWTGSPGGYWGDQSLVSWEAAWPQPQPALGIGQSADFWFTTAPTALGLTTGFVADPGLGATPGGLLAFPINAAPVPQGLAKPLFVRTTSDTLPSTSLTLREAITKLNGGVNDRGQAVTEIRFTQTLNAQTITLNSQLPTITTKMSINGENKGITITRDATKGNFRLLQVGTVDESPVVTISNLTLKGGGNVAGANTVTSGGAIESFGKLVLTGCTIRDNTAEQYGGGVSASAGTLDITNCDIFNNEAWYGGGVSIWLNVTAANITGGSIHHNEALWGGGIYIISGVDVPIHVTGVHIHLNQAEVKGGGIAVDEVGSPQLTLGGSMVIETNTAWGNGSKGGGVYFGAGTLTVLAQVDITGNGAVLGGGLYLVKGTSWSSTGDIFNNLPDDVFEEP